MPIQEICGARFNSRLRFAFRHASANRIDTDNIIAVVRGNSGSVGYGEGCPRPYVTGETCQSAATFLARMGPSIADEISDLNSLENWMDRHQAQIDENPAAFAALETALVDFLARESGVPIETFLGLPQLEEQFQYSGIVGISKPWPARLQAVAYRLFGFKDFKIKLSGDADADRTMLSAFVRAAPSAARLRADANNLWSEPEPCISHIRDLEKPFWALEEPLGAGNITGCRKIAAELGVKIILDESATRLEQLHALTSDPNTWIVNLRVSKMGGYLRSLRILKFAAKTGLPVIVGAHVGETSLLTRAGLLIAHACRHFGVRLLAQEGAFGRFLLNEDLCSPSLRFGYGGVLDANRLGLKATPGNGLSIQSQRLERL